MIDRESVPDLDGVLHYNPFAGVNAEDVLDKYYRDLLTEYEPQDILVLSRFRSGLDDVEIQLREAANTIRNPHIHSLAGHAGEVLGRLEEPPRVLSETERKALLHHHIRTWNWDDSTPYLASAASRDGFIDDVQRFITVATWQGVSISSSDEDLDELGNLLSAYRSRLASLEAIDNPGLIEFTTRAYQRTDGDIGTNRGHVTSFDSDPRTEFEAILVLDFEEFTPIDRAYLSYLSKEAELVCLATAHSSIQRVWNESGTIVDRCSLTVQDHTDAGRITSTTDAIASYLATGESSDPLDDSNSVYHLSGATFRDQVRAVSSEIERLVNDRYEYNDIAVVLRDTKSPIEDVIDELDEAGIPVDSTTVTSMEHDPTARELFNVAMLLRDLPDHGDVERVVDRGKITLEAILEQHVDGEQRLPSLAPDRSSVEQRLNRLLARIDTEPDVKIEEKKAPETERCPLSFDEVCTILTEAAAEAELDAALRTWMRQTQLTHRIARDEDEQTARNQFQDLERILELAEFHEEMPSLNSDWETFVQAFSEEMERSRTDKVPAETTAREGAVAVDAARVFKNETKKVVFVLDLVEGEFPSSPSFNRLFSSQRLASMPEYPALTNPDTEDVYGTFDTGDENTSYNPSQYEYYYALHRRFLAVAAKTAQEQLYFCSYERDNGILGETKMISRFLRQLEGEFGSFSEPDQTTLRARGEAETYALSRIDRALETTRRSVAVNDDIDLDAIEREFRIAQTLLEGFDDPTLEDAIQTQIAHAKGEVKRDD